MPSSENSTISGMSSLDSSFDKPHSWQRMSMFSMPDSFMSKPAESSSSADTRPCTSTVPDVGKHTPVIILSAVDLPAPLSPSSARDSPRFTVKLRSSLALTVSCGMRLEKVDNQRQLVVLEQLVLLGDVVEAHGDGIARVLVADDRGIAHSRDIRWELRGHPAPPCTDGGSCATRARRRSAARTGTAGTTPNP